MTDWTMQIADRDLRILLGAFLRKRGGSAKELARAIGCDPRSAENYRAGRYWPQAKHWAGLVSAFGKDVTEAVFHPDETAARLALEIRDLETRLAQTKAARDEAERHAARLREIAHGDPRRAESLSRTSD